MEWTAFFRKPKERLSGTRTVVAAVAAICLLVFPTTFFWGYWEYANDRESLIASDRVTVKLIADLIDGRQKAVASILESYARRAGLAWAVENRDSSSITRYLASLKANHEIDLTFATDDKGVLLANFPVFPEVMGQDLSYREWFKGASARRAPYISKVFKLIVGNKPLASAIAVPIFDAERNIIGFLATSQRLSFMADMMRNAPLTPYMTLNVIDDDGRVLYSNNLSGYEDDAMVYSPHALLWKAMRENRWRLETTESRNQDKLYLTFAPLGFVNWMVVAERTRGDLLRSQFRRFLEIGMAACLMSLIMTFYLLYFRKSALLKKTAAVLEMEKELRTRERAELDLLNKLNDAQRISNIGSWDWDLRSGNIWWSDEMYRILGASPREYVPTLDANAGFIHPEDAASFREAFLKVLKSGGSLSLDMKTVAANGGVKHCHVQGRVIRGAGGRPKRYIGVLMDITERKQMEEAIRENQAKLQSALASMTDAVFISDVEGRFMDFNDGFVTFHRFKSKDECAKTLVEYPAFLDVYAADGTLAPLETWAVPRALRGETVTNAEYSLRRKDTGETWVGSYSFAPIRDRSGVIVGSVVVGRDITDKKRAEEKLRGSLEEKVALLKEVHHRVKNNLQIVVSLLGLQANRTKNAEALEILNDARNRVRSMALLHEVLYRSGNLARISFPTYIADLCRQIAAFHGQAAQRVLLEHSVEDISLPLELAVPCGLIVNELVTNALKHAFPDGRSGKVLVEFHNVDERRLQLSVRDDGVGLSPGIDLENASTLGLLLVFELVGQLGGWMTVEKPDGGGALFRVVFPTPEEPGGS